MDSTVAGLLGAIIGALAVIGATFITWLLQTRQEHEKWLREKKQEAYANSLKYLLRVLGKRSEIGIESGKLTTLMGMDVQKEWFDDMSEVVTWLTILVIYCGPVQRRVLTETLEAVKDAVLNLIGGKQEISLGILPPFTKAYQVILSSAMQDIAGVGESAPQNV